LLLGTATTQVLVNGCPGASFRYGRGLRQGDPLSPLLFILTMVVLSGMLRGAEDLGIIADLAAVGLRHRVSLYADNIIVFPKPSSGGGRDTSRPRVFPGRIWIGCQLHQKFHRTHHMS
jgi:hypothetical protein